MPVKVWMVTSGHYSDYHVDGIFSTEEKAEEAKLLWNSENIEEIEMDSEIPWPDRSLLPYRVIMNREGNGKKPYRISASEDMIDQPVYWVDSGSYAFNMWAKDENHALKIANERRLQLLANNQWKIVNGFNG